MRTRAAAAFITTLAVLVLAPAAVAKDPDHDGLSNRYEKKRSHTNPKRRDTDKDRLTDGYEVRRSKTSPRRQDTDRDGLSDYFEVKRSKTSPRRKDTDRDGTSDALELLLDSDPRAVAETQAVSLAPSRHPLPPRPPRLPDLTAPETTITSGPSGTVSSNSASFSFTSSESGSSFACQLDTGAWSDCASPKHYSGLADGSHTFTVRATDAAGNTDSSPANRTWTVEVTSTGCGSASSNSVDGADPWGGCFPGPSNTGVLAGTVLSDYTGPCTITAANTVIEAKRINCDISVNASGLVIRNSVVRGSVLQQGGSAAFTITDSLIDGNDPWACINCGVGYRNFTVLRSEIIGTNRGAYCERSCLIQDSWIHGTNLEPVASNQAHASAVRVEQGATLVHNTLACDFDGPYPNDELGCSADISGYPDFAPIHHNTITNNLLASNNRGIGYCAYGGNTPGKPYSGDPTNATYVVYKDNVFQRGANGKCGAYGPITSFASNRTGNSWSGNTWDNGSTVPPAN
jgi:hypothetical protein